MKKLQVSIMCVIHEQMLFIKFSDIISSSVFRKSFLKTYFKIQNHP